MDAVAAQDERRSIRLRWSFGGIGTRSLDWLLWRRPRTAKSCGSGTPTLVLSFAELSVERRWQSSPVTGKSAKETV